jgi:predicted enzyme related to lactoylglutathione lyase
MAGDLVHFEIRAADAARAQGFWSSLLGWRFNATPGETPYTMTRAGGEGPTGGLYRSDVPDRGLIPYFSVEDLDASMERVRELGGEVRSSGDVPEVGRFAHCVDTEGNPFSLFWTDPAGHGPGPQDQ